MTQGFSFPGPALQGSLYSSNKQWFCSLTSSKQRHMHKYSKDILWRSFQVKERYYTMTSRVNHQKYQVSNCQSWNLHRAHQKQHPRPAVLSQLENHRSIWWPCSTAHSEFPLHLLRWGTEQMWQVWLIVALLESYELIRVNQGNLKFELALWCVKMRAVKIAHHFLLFLILPDKHLTIIMISMHHISTVLMMWKKRN